MSGPDVAATYTAWVFLRAILHRGWWLATSLYLVVEAGLSPLELVLVGTAQNVTGLVFEIPTGVLADTVSRKRSIVIAHGVMGTGMLLTGLVTDVYALAGTQMLWGLAWTFSSGADVAWLTDELDRPEAVPRVLARSARFEQLGGAVGMVTLGALAFVCGLATAIVVAGGVMWGLGWLVARRFPERHFTPAPARRWRAAASLASRALRLARRDRIILLVFLATFLTNGAGDAARLFPRQLLDLGLPTAPDPIVWLTALGLLGLLLAALALRVVEARIDGAHAAPSTYAFACALGALGLAMLALAPDACTGMAGILLVDGIAWTVTRWVGVIWINRRIAAEVRATVQSSLGQAEYLGEIVVGVGVGVLAQKAGLATGLLGACALAGLTAVLVAAGHGRGALATSEPEDGGPPVMK